MASNECKALKIRYRIDLLRGRNRVNNKIIAKLERQLRNLSK